MEPQNTPNTLNTPNTPNTPDNPDSPDNNTPDTPNTPDNEDKKKKRAPYVAPLWVSLGLLVLIALLGWGIWNDIDSVRKKHEQDVLDSLNALIEGRKRDQQCLNDLLAMKDCDIQIALEQGACQRKVHGAGGVVGAGNAGVVGAAGGTGGNVGNVGVGGNAGNAGNAGAPGPAAAGTGDPAKPGGLASADLVEQACVHVVTPLVSKPGKVGAGTGFFVAPGVVATNHHVVFDEDARQVVPQVFVESRYLRRRLRADVFAHERKPSGGRDYALLRVAVPAGIEITPLVFAAGAKKTEKVWAWGWGDAPAAIAAAVSGSSLPDAIASEGSVSTVETAAVAPAAPTVVHTAKIFHGNSGGPLVNAAGEVVGMNTYGLTVSTGEAYAALYGRDVLAFLKQHNVPAKSR